VYHKTVINARHSQPTMQISELSYWWAEWHHEDYKQLDINLCV